MFSSARALGFALALALVRADVVSVNLGVHVGISRVRFFDALGVIRLRAHVSPQESVASGCWFRNAVDVEAVALCMIAVE